MTSLELPDYLDLNLPDGRGVDLPPPVLPLEAFCEWLQMMHEERVRLGVLDRIMADPLRNGPKLPFRLD